MGEDEKNARSAAPARLPNRSRALGERLRESREAKGRAPDAASREAAIPFRYLRMFEEGKYPMIADPAYLTPFLRRYALYLGLDVDQATRDFIAEAESETAVRGTGRRGVDDALGARGGRARALGAAAAVAAAVAAGAVFAVVRFRAEPTAETTEPVESSEVGGRVTAPPRGTDDATARSAPLLASRPSAAPEPSPAPAPAAGIAPTVEAAATAESGSRAPAAPAAPLAPEPEAPAPRAAAFSPPFDLVLTASREVWIWISVDGSPRRAVPLHRGETRSWRAESGYLLTIDDAGGVSAKLNGRVLPSFGSGQQARRNVAIPWDLVHERGGRRQDGSTPAASAPAPTARG